MKTLIAALVTSFALCMFSLGQSIYTGVVGTTPVKASLTFANDQVTGTYTSKNSGKTYRLEGSNTVKGIANLIEFSFNEQSREWVPTAKVRLTKSVKNGTITWSGTMANNDGRNVAVRFTKTK